MNQVEGVTIPLSDFGYGITEACLAYANIGKKRDGFLLYVPGANVPEIVLSARLETDESNRNGTLDYLLGEWLRNIQANKWGLCFEQTIVAFAGRVVKQKVTSELEA